MANVRSSSAMRPRPFRAALLVLCVWIGVQAWAIARGGRPSLAVGVITVPERIEARAVLRAAYSAFGCSCARVYFVVGLSTARSGGLHELLRVEQSVYGDVVFVDAPEERDALSWKVLAFFQSRELARFTHVVKVDDDSFAHLPNLAARLAALPARGTLLGFAWGPPYGEGSARFMAGMGYAMSADLARLVASRSRADMPRTFDEDAAVTGPLMDVARAVVDGKPDIYDHPGARYAAGRYAHNFTESTLVVHQLKRLADWPPLIRHFFLSGRKSRHRC